jgi:hypothetical protein
LTTNLIAATVILGGILVAALAVVFLINRDEKRESSAKNQFT